MKSAWPNTGKQTVFLDFPKLLFLHIQPFNSGQAKCSLEYIADQQLKWLGDFLQCHFIVVGHELGFDARVLGTSVSH